VAQPRQESAGPGAAGAGVSPVTPPSQQPGTQPPRPPQQAQVERRYSPVTDQRLQNPEPRNWLMYRRTYDGQGYSPLDQININNVQDLVPVWTFSTGVKGGHQAPPIVNDGIMYITTPQAQVLALDAKTGDVVWRYKR
jgi:alcohol dehydrogenase (cytochrome c)